MNNHTVKKVVSVIACALLSSLFIVIMLFCAPRIKIIGETSGTVEYLFSEKVDDATVSIERITAEIGKDFTAVRISDLGRLGKITKVNYVADQFVNTNTLSPDIQIVDLTKPFDFAEKGTLIFVIMNLDPFAEDFNEQSERLAEYKIGEDWRFTLSLPKIFCASNVYNKTTLVTRNGNIENYDFINFTTSYDIKTDNFSAQTENTVIDLDFYARREALADAFYAAQVITVHYQSTGGAYSGIMDAPIIGTENAVKNTNAASKNLLLAFSMLAAVVLAVFVVLSLLKRTKEFVPAITWIFGIALLLFSRFILEQVTAAPLLWAAFGFAAPFVILGGALLLNGRDFGKVPTKRIFPALSVVGALVAFLCPFIPFQVAAALKIVCTVIKAVCVAMIIVYIAFSTFFKDGERGILKTINVSVIAVTAFASLFMPQVFPVQIDPLFWLCAATVVITFISVFILFKQTEKENEYLTANLHLEVARQIKDIKAVISERDRLLQFVSHDMKKPLNSAVILSDTAIGREKDVEQIKTLKIIKQNCTRVVSNLSEIADYAKFNYLAEPSQVVDLAELCALLFKYHQLDCDANGIILKNTVVATVKAFVKKQGLENVASNLIINAIEHANCSTITLSAKCDKNKVILCVADDGKGISDDMDVFRPYVSETDTETGGLGLYICKNIIESMNGDLTYSSNQNGSVFYISLLKS